MMYSTIFLHLADVSLDISHFSLVLFILSGWYMPRLRKAHLVVAICTGISWLIFSQGNGVGNCILTDLHYRILRMLGETNLPETYTQYTFERITGIMLQKDTSFILTRSIWLISLILSSALLIRDHMRGGKYSAGNKSTMPAG